MRGVTLPPQLLHGYNYNVVANQQHQPPQQQYQPQHQPQYQQQYQQQHQHPSASLSCLPGSREHQHHRSLGGGQQQHKPGPRPNYQNVPAIVVDQPQPSTRCGDSATFQRLGMRPGSHSESVVSEEAQQALETKRLALTQVSASFISVVANIL